MSQVTGGQYLQQRILQGIHDVRPLISVRDRVDIEDKLFSPDGSTEPAASKDCDHRDVMQLRRRLSVPTEQYSKIALTTRAQGCQQKLVFQ